MTRTSDKTEIVILDKQDAQNYRDAVAERIQAGKLDPNITVNVVVQAFKPENSDHLLCSWLVIDSTNIILRSHGPEPEWRRWLLIDREWNEFQFANIQDLYGYLYDNLLDDKKQFRFSRYYLNEASQYEAQILNTPMDLGHYVERLRSI